MLGEPRVGGSRNINVFMFTSIQFHRTKRVTYSYLYAGYNNKSTYMAVSEPMYEYQQALDPQGSRPLLTDPPLQLCMLPEAAQLGCLPGPEAAQLRSWLAGAEAEAIGSIIASTQG